MRLLFVASLVSVVAAAAMFACSASEGTAAPADAGKDAKPVVTGDDDDDDDDDTTADPDAGGGTIDTDGGTGSDATTDAPVASGDAGKACKADSTPEAEPNNDEGTATKPTKKNGAYSFCGQVATGDTDVFTFNHDLSGGFSIQPSGDQVKWKFQIGSQTFDGIPKNVNVNAGDKWIITVTSNSNEGRSYALRVAEE